MTFPAIRAMWTEATILTAAEMATFDDQMQNALDGGAGGTYAPSSALEIGGSGLISSAELEISGELRLEAPVLSGSGLSQGVQFEWEIQDGNALTFIRESGASSGGLIVDGAEGFDVLFTDGSSLTLNDGVDLTLANDGLVVSGGSLTFNSGASLIAASGATVQFDDLTVTDQLNVGDDLIVTDDVSIGGTLGVVGDTGLVNLSVGGTGSFFGDVDFNNPIDLVGDAHIRLRYVTGPDSNAERNVSQGDVHSSPATFSGSRTWTFDLAAHQAGDLITVRNTTATALVLDQGTGTFATLRDQSPGDLHTATFIHSGTSWIRISEMFTA